MILRILHHDLQRTSYFISSSVYHLSTIFPLAGTTRRQLYTLHQFIEQLLGRIGIRIVAHKNFHCWMIEDRIALIGVTIVEGQAKQVWMVLELCSQVKTELSAKK